MTHVPNTPDDQTRRYINLSAIDNEGGTRCTQVWTNDRAEALGILEAWIDRGIRGRSGLERPIVVATIFDPIAPPAIRLVRYAVDGFVARIIKEEV